MKMPKLLFIGSTVADIVIRVPVLPSSRQDVHIVSQQVSLGGCAFNAFDAAQVTGLAACSLLSPEGTGVWGDWVRQTLQSRGIDPGVATVEAPNGCCYCFVEPGGERTFLCEHGAEYRFRREWVADAHPERCDGVYLCGLEVEEATGGEIIDALTAQPPRCLYFAPGPRIGSIDGEKLRRIEALHPVYHLNDEEALGFTGAASIQEAAAVLHERTDADVIITLGAQGAYALSDGFAGVVPGFAAQVVDTIGAGDAHIGAVMAARSAGMSMPDALRLANRVSAAVVSHAGAGIDKEVYESIVKEDL